MRNVFLLFLICIVSIAGCGSDEPSTSHPPSAVGSDRDEHGCIGSAGYQWCARTEKCERPWELAKKSGFENTPGDFEEYCGRYRRRHVVSQLELKREPYLVSVGIGITVGGETGVCQLWSEMLVDWPGGHQVSRSPEECLIQ